MLTMRRATLVLAAGILTAGGAEAAGASARRTVDRVGVPTGGQSADSREPWGVTPDRRGDRPGLAFVPAATGDVAPAPAAGVLPPTDLEVASIVDRRLVLRWRPPSVGAPVTGYLLTWASEAGDVLGAIPLAGDVSALALTAPVGVFLVSLQTLSIQGPSEPSTVLRVNTGAPELPAAPDPPLVGGAGDVVTLTWSPRFGAGVPRRARVEIGDEWSDRQATFDVETAHLTLAAVPAGDYWVALSQVNESGAAGVTVWHSLTVPRACRPPATPERLGVFTSPGRLGAVWEPSREGDAPDGYDIAVAGSWSGELTLGPARVQEAAVVPGVYVLRVRARNACGVSDWTAAHTVAVP